MAQKKITDLQLRSSVTADLNFPSDDGIQSYRVTGLQIKNYVLAAGNVLRTMITANERIPIGAVVAFAGSTAPDGFLFCDGSAISRSTYSDLFTAIGTTHGTGNGTTTFNLPDTRGIFIRGVGSQAISGITYTGTLGTKEGDQFQNHKHDSYGTAVSGAAGAAATTLSGTSGGPLVGNPTATGGAGTPRVGSETRPANIALNYAIKY